MVALERMDALKRIASGVAALFLLKSRYCKPRGGRPQAFRLHALLFPLHLSDALAIFSDIFV